MKFDFFIFLFYQLFGVTVTSSSTTNYELSDGVIQKAHGTHQTTAVINIKSSVNSAVTAE